MSDYAAGIGNTVRLGPLLGKGGEGTVYSVQSDPQLAAKIYLPGLAKERRLKIAEMVNAKLHASAGFVAFPIDTLFDRSGAFAGFTMRKMGGRTPVHQLYSPTSRKTAFPGATYPLLVRAVSNVARALASVHASGCVVGDINHSGVLISDDATVVLIDSDSFQFSHSGHLYPCKVGVPEFTPPELQRKSLANVVRTSNHDCFGLAVLIFYTLMMGRHPFAGRYLGSGDMPMDRAISEFRFAYSGRRGATNMEPPPNVPTLADLPLPLGDAFERAFGPAGASGARLSAAEWMVALDKAETELVPCTHTPAHHYFRSAASCPWCRMERAYPGFQAFAPTFPVRPGGAPIDLGQLITAARGVADPGPLPDLTSLMPAVVTPLPNLPTADLRKARLVRWAGAIVGATIGLALLPASAPGPFAGLLFLLASGVAAFRPPAAVAVLQKNGQQARGNWRDAELTFRQAAGNEFFHKIRQDAEALIQRLQQLAAEETHRLAELNIKRRDAQLRRHLEQHDIDLVKIKGIGDARKLTLKSYGIETAADVAYHRIIAIHGFGPSTASGLIAWRQAVESAFRFDSNQGVNPVDISAIKSDIGRRQSEAEDRLRQTISDLQKASSEALAVRASPGNATLDAWSAWKHAEAHEKQLSPSPADLARLAPLAVGGLVALTIVSHIGPTPRQPTEVSPIAGSVPASSAGALATISPNIAALSRAPATTEAASPNLSSPAPTAAVGDPPVASLTSPTATPLQIGPVTPLEVRTVPSADFPVAAIGPLKEPPLNLLDRGDAGRIQERLRVLGFFNGLTDGVWGPKSRAALREFRRTQKLGLDDRWDPDTQTTLMSDRALRAGAIVPMDAVGTEAQVAPPPGAMRNPLNRADALWVQGRLRDLGFYSTDGDGVWGIASRDALRDFKAMNGLSSDDSWDAPTEQRLSGLGQTRATQTFVGGWASNPNDCGTAGSASPVTISSRRAEAFGGVCEFDDVQRDAAGWHVRGRCTADGRSWQADIQLTLNGSMLVWSSQRGVNKYFRCR